MQRSESGPLPTSLEWLVRWFRKGLLLGAVPGLIGSTAELVAGEPRAFGTRMFLHCDIQHGPASLLSEAVEAKHAKPVSCGLS